MGKRRVFVISGSRLTVHHRNGTKLLDPFSFDADPEGFAEFARYLARFAGDVTCVIADVVEEEFREEAVPHVFAWDRRALLRSKAARVFPGTRYFHPTRLGREPSGRRDDRVLFSAITRPEVLAPWLAPMARYAIPLAGIYSPAMLTGRLLKAIGAEDDLVLVVTLQSGGGLRQTCFRGGKLQLSRLAAVPDPAVDGYESHVLAEVERTRRYLSTLRSRPDDERLEVHVLSHGKPLDALRRVLQSDVGNELQARCSLVDLSDVARKLGMRRWGGESTADRLFVHLLARRPPPNHYATPREMRSLAMLRARTFLKTASAGLVGGACLLGGVAALEGSIASGYARTLAMQAMLYDLRHREARATLPPAPAEPAELERVVSAVHRLHRRSADPVDLLALISDALAGFPQVRVENLSWRLSSGAEAPVTAEDDDRVSPRPSGGETGHDLELLFQVARVKARIEPFDGDYRAAIDTVRRFAHTLAVPSSVDHVRVLALPLELSSEHTLTGIAETTEAAAAFEIRVALRVSVPGGAKV